MYSFLEKHLAPDRAACHRILYRFIISGFTLASQLYSHISVAGSTVLELKPYLEQERGDLQTALDSLWDNTPRNQHVTQLDFDLVDQVTQPVIPFGSYLSSCNAATANLDANGRLTVWCHNTYRNKDGVADLLNDRRDRFFASLDNAFECLENGYDIAYQKNNDSLYCNPCEHSTVQDLGKDLLTNWLPEGLYSQTCLGLLKTRVNERDLLYAGCQIDNSPWILKYNKLDLTLCGERTRIENKNGVLVCSMANNHQAEPSVDEECFDSSSDSGFRNDSDGVWIPRSGKIPPGLYQKICTVHWRVDNFMATPCYDITYNSVPIVTRNQILAAECLQEGYSTLQMTPYSRRYLYDTKATPVLLKSVYLSSTEDIHLYYFLSCSSRVVRDEGALESLRELQVTDNPDSDVCLPQMPTQDSDHSGQ